MKQSYFEIISNRPLTSSVYEMVMRGDTSHVTRPGQFVNIKLSGFFLRRPISVCDVVGDELLFTYSDGTQCSAGRFSGDTCITGFGISEAGELVIFYQNNMVGFSGTLQ